jgi:resuscitation-promoting factor RpfB
VRRSRFAGLALPLVLLVGVGSVGAFFLLGKNVTLVVDRAPRDVDTFAGTVGDLLLEQGVSIGEHDEVTPDPSSSLDDGMEIEVLLAKQITLSLNGTQRTVHVTGETVDDVLEQINLRAGRSAHISPSRGATVEEGDTIVYRQAVNVRVAADGEVRQVITNELTVGALLDNLGIAFDGSDEVTPSPKTPLSPGLLIRVVRVEISRLVEEQEIPFSTEVEPSNEYMQGVRKVIRAGVPGLAQRTFEVRLENGKEVARTLVDARRVRAPVTQLVVEGTRPPRSESGIASWYHRVGMVAAHPSLAFGTEVHVTNVANGRTVTVVINDRGPYVDGRIIDLSDDAFARLAPLGTGTINVRITW